MIDIEIDMSRIVFSKQSEIVWKKILFNFSI